MSDFKEEARREQFWNERQARDIFHSVPLNHARIQNLPPVEKICPVESRFFRLFGVRLLDGKWDK